jgi:hypothetical protein
MYDLFRQLAHNSRLLPDKADREKVRANIEKILEGPALATEESEEKLGKFCSDSSVF